MPSEPLSFFETLTAAAFLALRDARVDLAVVEVGLGGRLDATNVLDAPACTAITSIGRDHTRVLGKDLASIAVEKAGILRPGVALVCGPMATEAQNAIRAVARRTGAGPVWWTGEADGIRIVQHHERLELRGPDALAVTARVSLAGAHQQNNAAVAAGVAWQLPVLRPYLAQGLESVRWPGRLERLSYRQRVILLDCGHNEDATRALLRAVDGTPTLLFGAMEDKPWRTMLELLAPRTAARFYVPPIEEVAGRRPADVETLAQVAGGSTHATITDALDRAITETKIDATLLVTGSAYLVGAVRALVLGIASDARVPL